MPGCGSEKKHRARKILDPVNAHPCTLSELVTFETAKASDTGRHVRSRPCRRLRRSLEVLDSLLEPVEPPPQFDEDVNESEPGEARPDEEGDELEPEDVGEH